MNCNKEKHEPTKIYRTDLWLLQLLRFATEIIHLKILPFCVDL